ncbi:MAG: VOC family protein [Archangium sp.]|nr:VOC family protein [Archangium sp.]
MPAWTYGMFVWRELSTPDVDGALRFYGELAGWKSQKVDMPNGAYWLLLRGEKQVGGLMALAPGVDMPPYWMSYLSVPDVDAALAAAKGFGGEVVWGPIDVDDIGRMATVVDPRGGAFSLMKATKGDPVFIPPAPGEFCWEQLSSPDLDNARAFYRAVVGWKTMPFPGGQLETFGFGPRPGEQAATLVAVEGGQPGWMTFIVVDSLTAACARTVKLGGQVLSTETVVPGIGAYSVIRDPQGAVLGLFKA